ncbi:high mobility group nucleosome-binding domain-containing protein 4 isoform X1 [Macaca nemestrina]|uniref:high mobility group nucleosome-binding domain-containing protein 4 isoform X1 n=1 Tax=Macaca nemestrina TaxID=9545 RepID=UPI0039B95D43
MTACGFSFNTGEARSELIIGFSGLRVQYRDACAHQQNSHLNEETPSVFTMQIELLALRRQPTAVINFLSSCLTRSGQRCLGRASEAHTCIATGRTGSLRLELGAAPRLQPRKRILTFLRLPVPGSAGLPSSSLSWGWCWPCPRLGLRRVKGLSWDSRAPRTATKLGHLSRSSVRRTETPTRTAQAACQHCWHHAKEKGKRRC